MTWIKTSTETHPFVRLSELSVRIQRLALMNKIQTINSMIAMHTPKLQKHPKSKETLAEAQRCADKLLHVLHHQIPKAQENNNGQ